MHWRALQNPRQSPHYYYFRPNNNAMLLGIIIARIARVVPMLCVDGKKHKEGGCDIQGSEALQPVPKDGLRRPPLGVRVQIRLIK